MSDIDALAKIAVDCGFKLHEGIGPGLLESVYEALLAESLKRRGLSVARQLPIAIAYDASAFQTAFDLSAFGKTPHRLAHELWRGDLQRGRKADCQ